jgi:hypothetical protein
MAVLPVLARTYVRVVPRRSAKPPRHGSPLADQVRLSYHAVERFRRRAPELAGDEPRARLAELIAREGAVLSRPPSWFQGGLPSGGFLIGVQGRYVIPVRPVRSPDVLLARPWRAITFIARELSADDLRELTGEELVALTLITGRVARKWLEHTHGSETDGQPPDAVTQLRHELASIPPGGEALAWVPADIAGRDALHVTFHNGTLVLVRPRREEQHRVRFRTVAWVPDRSRRPPTQDS